MEGVGFMPAIKDERLNLRLSASADALIRDAAETLGTSVSDYVTQSAIQRAHQVLADQRHFTLDDATWNRFLDALDRPAKVNERLAALLRRPSLLDDED
jgi:uncharacterized protein (DUF1778 family)